MRQTRPIAGSRPAPLAQVAFEVRAEGRLLGPPTVMSFDSSEGCAALLSGLALAALVAALCRDKKAVPMGDQAALESTLAMAEHLFAQVIALPPEAQSHVDRSLGALCFRLMMLHQAARKGESARV